MTFVVVTDAVAAVEPLSDEGLELVGEGLVDQAFELGPMLGDELANASLDAGVDRDGHNRESRTPHVAAIARKGPESGPSTGTRVECRIVRPTG